MRAEDPQGFVLEWTITLRGRLQTSPSLFPFRLGCPVSILRQSVCSLPGGGAIMLTVVSLAISQAGSCLSLCAHVGVHTLVGKRRTPDEQKESSLAFGDLGEAGASPPPPRQSVES